MNIFIYILEWISCRAGKPALFDINTVWTKCVSLLLCKSICPFVMFYLFPSLRWRSFSVPAKNLFFRCVVYKYVHNISLFTFFCRKINLLPVNSFQINALVKYVSKVVISIFPLNMYRAWILFMSLCSKKEVLKSSLEFKKSTYFV